MLVRVKLLIPCLCLGAGLQMPAHAADSSSAPAVGTDLKDLMQEVVVTARRREEKLIDTPISITAFSGPALEARGITRTDDLASVVPNLVFQENPGAGGSSSSAAVFIRGVGQSDFIPTVEPGVGLYVDGVYVASAVGSLLDLVDVASLEVLRGPQGTLFGRNTIGGAINVTSEKPNTKAFSGVASILYGTDNRREVKAKVNLPITSTISASLSAALIKQDGYVDDVGTGQELGDRNNLVGKMALRWQGDNMELNFSIDGTRTRENGAAFVLRDIKFGSAIFNPAGLPLAPPGSGTVPGHYTINPPADAPVDNFSLFNNYIATLVAGAGNCLGLGSASYNPAGDQTNKACYGPQYFGEAGKVSQGTLPSISDDDLWGAHLTYDWTINDDLRFKSISAYRHVSSHFQRDGDESPLTIYHLTDNLSQYQVSEELQLDGDSFDRALKWVTGLYYFDEKAVNPNLVDFAPITVLSGGASETKSYAAFAQATYNITQALAVTAGLRYTEDKKSFSPNEFVVNDKGGPFPIGTPVLPSIPVDRNFNKVTPLANLSYHIDTNTMVYGTYSKGFKSGGFTQRVFPPLPATPTFDPETVTSYEVGFKTAQFDGMLNFNAAAYLTNYDDIQVSIFNAIAPITANGGTGRVKGLELETQVSPGGGWYFEADAGLTDAYYTSIAPGATDININSQFAFVSKWQWMIAGEKQFVLPGNSHLSPRLEWTYRTHYFNDALNTPEEAQPGYGLLNGLLTWTSANSKFSAILGVKNALDKDYIIAAYFTPGSGPVSVIPDRGREWYVQLKSSF
ncbi:MAG: iron complex outerrane recepter protein [Gammaproteobacteria bacterium]|nr:iron complex outerrane recepter protein [Gammaproteobacteria bacterium]